MNNKDKTIEKTLHTIIARMHLDKSRVRGKFVISDEMRFNFPKHKDDLDNIIRERIMSNLIREAISNYSNLIREERNSNFTTEYSIDLTILPTDMFKECLIQLVADMPLEEILKIRESRK